MAAKNPYTVCKHTGKPIDECDCLDRGSASRLLATERAAREYGETLEAIREALGQTGTHYFVMAGDVKVVVDALKVYAKGPVEGGPALAREALYTLQVGSVVETTCEACDKKIRIGQSPRAEDGPSATFCPACGGGCTFFRYVPSPKEGSLTYEQLVEACRNFGIDITCGRCAAQFFTGTAPYEHDATCRTKVTR